MIREATEQDCEAIKNIYNHYVLNAISTFEEIPLTDEKMLSIMQSDEIAVPWLVYVEEEEILGYAYAGKWKSRSAYRYSAAASVYLKPGHTGKGIGSKLYQALFDKLKEANYHVIMAGISLPNPVSVAIHEKFGFVKSAHYKEIGFKFGKWIDVGYWQLILPNKPSKL